MEKKHIKNDNYDDDIHTENMVDQEEIEEQIQNEEDNQHNKLQELSEQIYSYITNYTTNNALFIGEFLTPEDFYILITNN